MARRFKSVVDVREAWAMFVSTAVVVVVDWMRMFEDVRARPGAWAVERDAPRHSRVLAPGWASMLMR
ncbi:hypothetical protein ACG7TL_001822 [Trametes sanguinea]